MKNSIFIKYVLFLFCLLPSISFAQGIVQCEYWFDGDINNKVIDRTSGSEACEIIWRVPTEQLDDGLHLFNFRAQQSDGSYSPILSRMFFKSAASKSSMLEYWFDDDYDKRVSTELSSTDEEGNVAMSLDLSDNTKFPIGNHRLHLRVKDSHGVSAVYTSSVLKLMSGKIELLEYWLDGDNSKAGYIYGKDAEGGKLFEQVDLSNVSEGIHRLYYRGVSASGGSSTAISSTPIMVKPRYLGDPSTAVITSYKINVDKNSADFYQVENAGPEKEIVLNLDTRSLKKGKHTVNASIWNSFGATTSMSSDFEVTTPPKPSLTLTATEGAGRVALNFNSIPGDMQYKVYREDANGVKVVVKNVDALYPIRTTVFDEPGNGTFNYQIKCKYQDFSQKVQLLESPKVSITIGQSETIPDPEVTPEPEQAMGYVTGVLVGTGENPEIMHFINSYDNVNVEVTDGVNTTSQRVKKGYFSTDKYPVGTVLTLTVTGIAQYKFKPVQVTVAATPRKIAIQGELVRKVDETVKRYELNLASDLMWQDTYITFVVENRSWNTWKGKVGFTAINEEAYNAALISRISPSEMLFNPEINERLWYTSLTEEEITIPGKSTQQVLVPLSGVFPADKRDYYNFYFISEGRDANAPEETKQQKPIYFDNYTYNATNPIKRQIDKTTLESAKDMVRAQNAEYAANLILKIIKGIEGVDKYLGYTEDYLYAVGSMSSQAYDAVKTNGFIDLVEQAGYDPGVLSLSNEGRLLLQAEVGLYGSNEIRKFREHVVNSILKDNRTVDKYVGSAITVLKALNNIADIYEGYRKKTEYEKTFIAAKEIFRLSGVKEAKPFGDILAIYLDVTEAFANAALSLGQQYYDYSSAALMYENRPEPEDKEDYPYNRHIDFKIKVDYGGVLGKFSSFDGEEVAREIKDVKVYVANRPNAPDQVAMTTFEPVAVSNGVMLRQTTFDNGAPIGHGSLDIAAPFHRMWMTIKWRNGRVSIVPLLNKGSVTFDQPNFFGRKTYQYTVTFQSKAGWSYPQNMADILQLKD